MKRIILQLGNPRLRLKAKDVTDIQSRQVNSLITDLLQIVKEVDGVGISAPQVGVNSRIFILASRPNKRYPNAPFMEPTAIINPKIVSHSKKTLLDWEGCLSIPGIRALVARFAKIGVEYTNTDGILIKRDFEGFIAKIFQHELDHLNGILFLDRVKNNRNIVTDLEYQKIIHKKLRIKL